MTQTFAPLLCRTARIIVVPRRKKPSSMSRSASEIATQPDCRRRAAEAGAAFDGLPRPGERGAVTGCGTSWFMAIAYAALREAAGQGETDAYPSSEFPAGRPHDRVVAITRSGTTTEVLELLGELRGKVTTVALTAAPKTPVMDAADAVAVRDMRRRSGRESGGPVRPRPFGACR
ncbi:hypothetical protein GA0115254_111645 [Streptomyces sp. Ncost-T10-10d]|nr:hypothetical protein GA0115254_111645 [Streptomyces sp. Ncost-T10-10d]